LGAILAQSNSATNGKVDGQLIKVQATTTAINGTIPNNTLHYSLNVISGTATIGSYQLNPANTPVDFPYINGNTYTAASYTVAPNSELQILLIQPI
jgi:hypothetical protein